MLLEGCVVEKGGVTCSRSERKIKKEKKGNKKKRKENELRI